MKKLIKNSIVPILSSRPVSAIASRLFSKGIAIFMLHRFTRDGVDGGDHKPSMLRDFLSFLRENGYQFISLNTVVDAALGRCAPPDKAVAFTMDDGFYDQAEIGASIFLEYDSPVTIFLISGMLDGKLWPWDDQVAYLIGVTRRSKIQLNFNAVTRTFPTVNSPQKSVAIKQVRNWLKILDGNRINEYISALSIATEIELPDAPPEQWRPMSWSMARDLEKRGVQFAPHTISHRILSSLDAETSACEISGSWKRLSDELVSPLNIFGYPTGLSSDYGQREIDYLRTTGFRGAVSAEPTFVTLDNNDTDYVYTLPRFGLPDTITDLAQYSSWIERAKTTVLGR